MTTDSRSAAPEARARYHHSDLHAALLRAVGEVLAEQGPDALSLREVARRAGVSHGAPAHHFGDARGLLTAYAAEAFGQLTQALKAAIAQEAPPDEHMKRLARAYVSFALAHPARYQLMFRSARLNDQDAGLQQNSAAAYGILADCAARATGQARHSTAGRAQITLAWSVVHGFALLAIDGASSALRESPERLEAELAAMLDALQPAWQAARSG